MTVVQRVFKFLLSANVVALVIIFSSSNVLANVSELLSQGDNHRLMGDYPLAEKAYTEALEKEPKNYRILKSLVEVKVILEKYAEAKPLAKKILSRRVMLQKKVKVFVIGQSDALEGVISLNTRTPYHVAELVDETVVAAKFGKTNMRNYLDSEAKAETPHYRLFFLDAGKMKLVPKNEVRIEYIGVPRLDYERVQELYSKIQSKLIDVSGVAKKIEMVSVGGGCFDMGSAKGSVLEGPVHKVCLSPFKIEKHEVTQKYFQSVMKTNPSRFVSADLPVESVTWQEADKYCKKIGKRLPTEAEWEFAARGGTTTEYYWGEKFDSSRGNFCDVNCDMNIRVEDASDGYKYTAPVGKFPPNPLGLYDMSGNVAEWVADWMDAEKNYYIASPKDNPLGPDRKNAPDFDGGANEKIFRGGSWGGGMETLRSAWRKALFRGYRFENLGFRCAKDI
jgi:formylglycine-generating enzyme required for sulfatase activity